LNNCVLDLKHNLSDVSEKITVMLGEMTNCVKSGEFLAIKKYIELWQPERFVTKKEVEDIMDTSKSNHNTLQ
ncbi:MAG: hypothetical protein KKG59_05000, partial [Nanoarchaeota archaeon]|nr:hypothetical protein [Nanoarchaeota archaeon]